MSDLFTALGLAVMIEGIAYALFPDSMRRVMARAALMPSGFLRVAGLIAAMAGVAVVWLVRSVMIAP